LSFEALSLIEIDHPVYQASFSSKKKLFQWRQVKLIQTRNKQDLQMIKMENISFLLIEWQTLFPGPSQAPIHLAEMSPQDLYYECLKKEMHGNVQFRL
jgi:hypothetical protein